MILDPPEDKAVDFVAETNSGATEALMTVKPSRDADGPCHAVRRYYGRKGCQCAS